MASPTSESTRASLSLETSHSCPPRLAPSCSSLPTSALASPTPSPSPSPSPFALTLRIIRLVNSFRKRVKPRVYARQPKKEASAKARRDLCEAFERQAFDEIDRYLGRKTTHPQSKDHKVGGGDLPSVATANKDPTTTRRDIDWLLEEINRSVTSNGHALSHVAKHSTLFFGRRVDLHIKRLSVKELPQLLVTVKDLLDTLRRASPPDRGARTLCEGNEVLDLGLDETYLANLEHLLLGLLDQLLRLLISQLVDHLHQHVLECQKDQIKHCEEWFFEFPDARHPVSTTWPWSIRPSLAVIWGVCWMFFDVCLDAEVNVYDFDAAGNMVDDRGVIVMSALAIQHIWAGMQQQQWQQPLLYPEADPPARHPDLGLHHLTQPHRSGPTLQPQSQGAHPYLADSPSQCDRESRWSPHAHSSPVLLSSPPIGQDGQIDSGDQDLNSTYGLVGQPIRNTYGAAPRSARTGFSPAIPGWLPQENSSGLQHHQGTLGGVSYPADHSWAPPFSPAPTGHHPLPLPAHRPLTPNLRLTVPGHPSAVHHYPTSSTTSRSFEEELPIDPFFFTNARPQQQMEMATMSSSERLIAPVSPPISAHSPHVHQNMTLPEVLARGTKRSHSEMREVEIAPPVQLEQPSRPTSLAPHSDHGSPPILDDYSPRGSRSFKRGDPPVGAEGKYFCDFAPECTGQTFDRKCEWSKHMDKHDRPYRCQNRDCAKLQGFTYSGGLLRHEREVHGKHGGPKEQLVCPHEDCKRHVGKGFTRKENLNEHLRRVHENKSLASQPPSQMSEYKQDTSDHYEAVVGAEQHLLEPPPVAPMYNTVEPMEEPNLEPLLSKRKRDDLERSPSIDIEDLRREIKRLRDDNASKDERLRRMEAAEAMHETQIMQMQHSMAEFQRRVHMTSEMHHAGQALHHSDEEPALNGDALQHVALSAREGEGEQLQLDQPGQV